ncbi:MAG: hypothetical protein R2699_03205 [Acidimicrobiales bacterium]
MIEAVKTGSTALGRFVKFDISGGVEALKQVEWLFLIPLLGGIGAAVVSLAGIIEHQPRTTPRRWLGSSSASSPARSWWRGSCCSDVTPRACSSCSAPPR